LKKFDRIFAKKMTNFRVVRCLLTVKSGRYIVIIKRKQRKYKPVFKTGVKNNEKE